MPKWILSTLGLVLIIFVGSLCYGTWCIVSEVKNIEPSILQTTKDLDEAAKQATKTFEQINRPCLPAPCGTLADVNQTLHTIRGAVGQVEVAAKHENENLNTLDSDYVILFNNLNGSIKSFNGAIHSADTAIAGLVPVETKFLDVEMQASTTFRSANEFITSPNFVKTTTHIEGISDHIDGLTGDITTKTHEFLYPAPCKGKLCWLKRTYTILDTAGKVAEPTYWGIEAAKALGK